MLSEVRSENICSPGLGKSSDAIPPSHTSSLAKDRLSARPAHRSSRRVSIATRQRSKDSKRSGHGKYWNPIFFQRRSLDQKAISQQYSDIFSSHNGTDSESTTETEPKSSQKQAVDEPFSEELIDMFLQDWDVSIPSWEAKVVRRFFAYENDEASTQHDSQAWAWLDDREYSTGLPGEYPSRMSDIELRAALNQPVLFIIFT